MDVVKDSNSKEDTCNSIVESSATMLDYPNLGTCTTNLGLDLGFYDSGFIQRAASFSCFGEMMNPCSEMPQHKNDVLSKEASLPKQNDQSNQTPTPTPTRSSETKQKADQDTTSNSKPKEEYLHVRARRGQATNSHSLAERVRREKISERMKFLQDLVPGCSKVTGKAVMLDEIINYVQSLQRQVEFLSMKLATVNPRLDFNIEGLLQPRAGISSSLGLLPEMAMPFPPIHPPQGLIHPEAIRRSIPSVCGGSKDPFSQVSNVWEDELHNIVQMGFNLAPPPTSQDLSSICTGSLPPGHMKAEP